MARRHLLTVFLTSFLTLVSSTGAFSSQPTHPARTVELRYRLVEFFRALRDGQHG
jgi:hypothetical protein